MWVVGPGWTRRCGSRSSQGDCCDFDDVETTVGASGFDVDDDNPMSGPVERGEPAHRTPRC